MKQSDQSKNILSNISKKIILLSSKSTILDAINTLKNRKGNDTWFLIVNENNKYKFTRIINLRKFISTSEVVDLDIPLSKLEKIFKNIECLDFSSSIADAKIGAEKNSEKVVLINWEDTILGIIDFSKEYQDVSHVDKRSNNVSLAQHSKPMRINLKEGINKLDLVMNWAKKNVILSIIGFIILVGIPTAYFYIDRFYKETKAMSGEWNIAVSSFYLKGDVGIKKDDARNIAKVFFNRLNSEVGDLFKTSNIVCELRGPEDIEIIEGDTEGERSIHAQEVAKKINADMLIYGSIEKIRDDLELKPEFYISIKNFYEADELTGNHILGRNIKLIAGESILPSQLNLNRDLSLRAQVLSSVVRGLSYYLIHDYVNSYTNFKKANNDNLWESNEGRQTIYLLEGNAAGRAKMFEESKSAYLNAIEIDPDYARAYIGLGGIYYLLSMRDKSSAIYNPNTSFLNDSIKLFKKALGIKKSPKLADITTKAEFGLGQAYLALWFSGNRTLDVSIKYFNKVLKEYKENRNYRIKEIAAESHARLGFVNFSFGKIDEAEKEFEESLKLSSMPERRALYYSTLSDIQYGNKKIDLANQLNESAIKEYESVIKSPIVDFQYVELLLSLSRRYEKQTKLKEAENYAQKALNYIKDNDGENQKKLFSKIFERFAEIKREIGEYDQSTDYYYKAIDDSNDLIQKAIYFEKIAQNKKVEGDKKGNIALLLKAIEVLLGCLNDGHSEFIQSIIKNKISQIYEDIGDLSKATLFAAESLKTLNYDSIYFSKYKERLELLKLKRKLEVN